MTTARKKSLPTAPRRDRAGAPSGRRGASGDTTGAGALDERALAAIEAEHPAGLTSAQIVTALDAAGLRVSEATFRKWVQQGLLPRSRRVGRKGKHQGSLGLYPASTVRSIAAIRGQMSAGLTVEEIGRLRRLRDHAQVIERGVDELVQALTGQLAAGGAMRPADRSNAERHLDRIEKLAAEIFRRVGILERLLVEPLERVARERAFGSGTSGGAADLL